MTLQDEIDALLAEAAPLRLLPDDEAEAKGLPALVEKINRLRAKQARDPFLAAETEEAPARKKPGPKPRATIEGSDAP